MPTTTFFGIEIAKMCRTWIQEPWVCQNSTVRLPYVRFIAKAFKVVRWDQGPDGVYIHLYHTFDSERRQYAFCRNDFVHALYKWMLYSTTTDIDAINQNYNVIKVELEELEAQLDPSRNVTPVECLFLDGPVYMNGYH